MHAAVSEEPSGIPFQAATRAQLLAKRRRGLQELGNVLMAEQSEDNRGEMSTHELGESHFVRRRDASAVDDVERRAVKGRELDPFVATQQSAQRICELHFTKCEIEQRSDGRNSGGQRVAISSAANQAGLQEGAERGLDAAVPPASGGGKSAQSGGLRALGQRKQDFKRDSRSQHVVTNIA